MHHPVFIFLLAFCWLTHPATAQNDFVFVDVSADVDTLTNMANRASGPAWGDFNNDGYQDLYIAAFEVNRLFMNNRDGTFTDISVAAGVNDSTKSKAANWGDIDNDGFLDLYISNNRGSENKLYYNVRNGTFNQIAQPAGVADTAFAQGGAWVDYDADGRLDFLLMQDDTHDRLFHNDGTFAFTDLAEQAGVDNEWGAYGLSWFDYNDDNHIDLFVANCANHHGSTWTNLLFENNGDGTFTDISAQKGVDYFGESWGVNAFDYDNDLDIDILVSNTDMTNTFLFYENQNGDFAEISDQIGLEPIGFAKALTHGDYDNDGDVDFLVTGFPPANALYENRGGTFVNVAERVQFPTRPGLHLTGAATADYDNDGFLDFVIADENSRAYLYHNEPPDSVASNTYLTIRLEGVQSNKFGIGSKVVTVAEDLKQIRYVMAGSGVYSQDMLPVHFGFGARQTVDSLIVRWPSGAVDIHTDLPVNQIVTITEGGPVTHLDDAEAAPNTFVLQQNFPNPFNPSTTIPYSLAERGKAQLSIYNILGERIRTFDLGTQEAGSYQVTWDGTNQEGKEVASGVYVYKLQVGQGVRARKMVLSR